MFALQGTWSCVSAQNDGKVIPEEITKQFITLGLVPIGKGSLDELKVFVKSETVRWAKAIQNAGLAGTQ